MSRDGRIPFCERSIFQTRERAAIQFKTCSVGFVNMRLEPRFKQKVDIATHWLALPHQCKTSKRRRNQLNVSAEERLTDGSKTSEKVLERNAALRSIYGAAQSAD